MATANSAPPSTTAFRSVNSPHEYDVDWANFYPLAWDRGQALRRQYRHEAGVQYGTSASMTMNIFYPDIPRRSEKVVVYAHGGGFSEGHPDFADFVGERLLERGVTFVSVGYRLAPTRFPDSASDVAKALAFLDRHLPKQNTIDRHYCLAGHSAGASIAALLGVRPSLLKSAGLRAGAVDSLVLVSGIYDFDPPDPSSAFVDPAMRTDASAVRHARDAPRQTLVVHGSPELNRKGNSADVFKLRAVMLEGALKSHGHEIERLELKDADHVSTASALLNDQVLARINDLLESQTRNHQ